MLGQETEKLHCVHFCFFYIWLQNSGDFLGLFIIRCWIFYSSRGFLDLTPRRWSTWTFLILQSCSRACSCCARRTTQRGRSHCHTADRWIHRRLPLRRWIPLLLGSSQCLTRIENCLAPRPSCCLQRVPQGHGWCRRSLGCSPWSPHSALSPSSCTGGCTWSASI